MAIKYQKVQGTERVYMVFVTHSKKRYKECHKENVWRSLSENRRVRSIRPIRCAGRIGGTGRRGIWFAYPGFRVWHGNYEFVFGKGDRGSGFCGGFRVQRDG